MVNEHCIFQFLQSVDNFDTLIMILEAFAKQDTSRWNIFPPHFALAANLFPIREKFFLKPDSVLIQIRQAQHEFFDWILSRRTFESIVDGFQKWVDHTIRR